MGAATQVHYSEVLTNVAVQFKPTGLVAETVFPPVAVNFENDVYKVFDKSLFDVVDDIRADGAESNEIDMGWSYVPYQCSEHSLRALVTERERKNSKDPDDLEAMKTEQVKQTVYNRMEQRMFGTGGLCRTAANFGSSTNLDWSNAATATPRKDVQTMISSVEVASGISPNHIIASKETFRGMTRLAEWREESKYTNDLRADNDIPDQFYGLKTITVESLINTADRGQARTLARLMDQDIAVCYINPGGLGYRELTWGCQLYTEEYASSWFVDERRSTWVEYGRIYTLHVVAKECAALGTSVFTA